MLHGYLLKEYIQPPAQASSRFHALAPPKPFPRDVLAVVTGPSGDLVPAGCAGRLLCSRVLPSEVAGPALWCGDRHALPVTCHGSWWPVGPCWGTGAALQPTHVSTAGLGWGCPRGTPAGAVPRGPGAVCHPRPPLPPPPRAGGRVRRGPRPPRAPGAGAEPEASAPPPHHLFQKVLPRQ